MSDLLEWGGDFPQDWPPGPIIPANEAFEGNQTVKITNTGGTHTITTTVNVGTPTAIGDQINNSTPAASAPPSNPSNLPGTPLPEGEPRLPIPPTYGWSAS